MVCGDMEGRRTMKRSWAARVCVFAVWTAGLSGNGSIESTTLVAATVDIDNSNSETWRHSQPRSSPLDSVSSQRRQQHTAEDYYSNRYSVVDHDDREADAASSPRPAPTSAAIVALQQRPRHRKTTTVDTEQFKTVRINCGGGMVKEADGTVWMRDKYYNRGFRSRGRLQGGISGSAKKRSTVFASFRYDYGRLLRQTPLTYNIPVPNGEYEVTLYFPNQLISIAPKLRRFNVNIEGLVAFKSDAIGKPKEGTTETDDGIDSDNTAAQPTAASMTSLTIVEDGTLTIVFDACRGRRVYVSAIVVESLSGDGGGADASDWPTPAPLQFALPVPTLPRQPTTRAPILQAQPSTPMEPLRINAGGDAYVDTLGKTWMADVNFTGGLTFANANLDVSGTQDDALFHTERNGDNFGYEIAIPVGNYEIILHFAELVYNALAQRVFDVEIEDVAVFADVDLIKLGAGDANKAVVLETVELVSDGALSIVFKAKIGTPKVSALEIKLSAPHYAHAVTGGPYLAVDSLGAGSTLVSVDGSGSHTHGPGLRLTQFVWKTGAQVLGQGEYANLTLPVGDHVVTLTVTDDGGNDSTDTTNVTVRSGAFPSVTNLLPNSGPISGGNDVTIIGSGFTVSADQIVVKFGLVTLTGSASIQIVDTRTLKIKAPSVSVGVPVSVSVATPLGESSDKKYTYVAKSEIKFLESRLATIPFPTRALFGPDEKLYVATVDGKIAKMTLDARYNVIHTMIATVAKDRVILGLAFDPSDTTIVNPPIYFTHWRIFHGESKSTSGQSINGKVSIAKGANLDQIVDVITGLPVSDGDHGVNGLEFGDKGELYIQVGGNTNAGIPGRLTTSQKQKDMVLSAATLVAYLSRPNFRGFLSYTADDDGDVNPSDVEIFAFGLRNPVGIVLHTNGNLYGTNNGPDKRYGDMLQSCAGDRIESIEEKDNVNLLVQGGYYGHPNLKRGLTDARQCKWQSQRAGSNNGYTAPMVIVPSSTNGIVEFHANHFDGQMRGNLITCQYKGGMYRIILAADGKSVVPESVEPSQFAGNGMLDVTQHPDGTLVDTRYEDGDVFYYKPIIRTTRAVLILSVFPRRGPLAGGSRLVVYGRNFNKNSATTATVKVGSNVCKVTTVTATQLECTLPGGSGTVDVAVTVGSETSTFARGYRYIPGN